MKHADLHCILLFDEMSLSSGFHYDQVKQYIRGFEYMGSLGRSNKPANHALVLMASYRRNNFTTSRNWT
ncbi:unnamed protein product [Tenebrio molitor]|nr:unnamed protein product [Tenebrio molitor]